MRKYISQGKADYRLFPVLKFYWKASSKMFCGIVN
jgi:hypothetical protein